MPSLDLVLAPFRPSVAAANDSLQCLKMYSRPEVVAHYLDDAALQKPEAAILQRLEPQLGAMRMLEIGVGAGRLTGFFAPRAKEYYAIDIAPEMIDACRARFAGTIPAAHFSLGDMRNLGR